MGALSQTQEGSLAGQTAAGLAYSTLAFPCRPTVNVESADPEARVADKGAAEATDPVCTTPDATTGAPTTLVTWHRAATYNTPSRGSQYHQMPTTDAQEAHHIWGAAPTTRTWNCCQGLDVLAQLGLFGRPKAGGSVGRKLHGKNHPWGRNARLGRTACIPSGTIAI